MTARHSWIGVVHMDRLLHRKQMIIFTAIDVMNDFGIQGLSTKEIARRQGISESTIFKHFKTKNEIVHAILDFYSQFDEDIAISAEKQASTPLQAIILFSKAYAEYYENYPAITAITQAYDVLRYYPELMDKLTDIVNRRDKFLKNQIEKAKDCNLIRMELNSDDLVDVLNGTFTKQCLKWRMSNYQFNLKEKILSIRQMLLESFG